LLTTESQIDCGKTPHVTALVGRGKKTAAKAINSAEINKILLNFMFLFYHNLLPWL